MWIHNQLRLELRRSIVHLPLFEPHHAFVIVSFGKFGIELEGT